jgi:hypothetical protein
MKMEKKIKFANGIVLSVPSNKLIVKDKYSYYYFWSDNQNESVKDIFFDMKNIPKFVNIDPLANKIRGLYLCSIADEVKVVKRKTNKPNVNLLVKKAKVAGVPDGHKINENRILKEILNRSERLATNNSERVDNCDEISTEIQISDWIDINSTNAVDVNVIPNCMQSNESCTRPGNLESITNLSSTLPDMQLVQKQNASNINDEDQNRSLGTSMLTKIPCENCQRLKSILNKQNEIINLFKSKMYEYEKKLKMHTEIKRENKELSSVVKSELLANIRHMQSETVGRNLYSVEVFHKVVS